LNTFAAALRTKDFVVTSELLLGPQSGGEHINEQAEALRGHVDGVLVTDNQSGRLHMSSLVASWLLKQAGIDPIMQLGCRNRNRISLLGDLLGANALDIRNIQLVRGERVPDGFAPRPNALLDMTATELIEIPIFPSFFWAALRHLALPRLTGQPGNYSRRSTPARNFS
jgi:methylenetetrahydrofolate reductase (NADPH)